MIPRVTWSIGSGTPITPVEATATRPSGAPATIAAGALHLGRVVEARTRPVAALALPELTTTARSAPSSQRSVQSSTGAASTPERVKRAALVVLGRVGRPSARRRARRSA